MYKLIIADDESIIREGLKGLVDWNELGFEIIETFSDGEEVIEFLDSMPADVVLTDIKMKRIGGIDVARYVQENELPCKVVFISGHQEFELALQAVKYRVRDYILKPSTVESIREVFGKIKKELDAQTRNREYQARMQEYWAEVYPVFADKFVGSLIMGGIDDTEIIDQRMQFLYPDVEAGSCPCMLVHLQIPEYDEFMQTSWNYSADQFDNALYNFVRFFQKDGYFHIIYKNRGSIRLFVILKVSYRTPKENADFCNALIRRFEQEFQEIFRIKTNMEIDRIFPTIYQVIESREELAGMSSHRTDTELYLLERKKMLMTSIMQGNINTAQKIMQTILKSISESDPKAQLHSVADIFHDICGFLKEKNPSLLRSIQPFLNDQTIRNLPDMKAAEFYSDRIFDKMKTTEGMSKQFDTNRLVNRIKEYVVKHILEDIRLEDAANEIFISTTHLSRIFKQQTGETFLQYVTKKKMEKAAELLSDPHYKIYQVGECLGYKTPRYFSKLFYNVLGYYPSQYRREILHFREESDEEA